MQGKQSQSSFTTADANGPSNLQVFTCANAALSADTVNLPEHPLFNDATPG